MHFLIDADLPRSTKALLEQYGHAATDVRDIGLSSAQDPTIAAYAHTHGLVLLTGDFGFSDIRNYPPETYAGIVVLELPRDATAPVILRLLETFLHQPALVAKVPGRLVIVAPGRVRLRPP